MVVKLTKSPLCLKRSGTNAGGTRSRKMCTMTLHQTQSELHGLCMMWQQIFLPVWSTGTTMILSGHF